MSFFGAAPPTHGPDEAAWVIESGLVEMWALMSVEASGCVYLPDRCPKILFERPAARGGAEARTSTRHHCLDPMELGLYDTLAGFTHVTAGGGPISGITPFPQTRDDSLHGDTLLGRCGLCSPDSPSVEIQAVQIALTYEGYPVGRVDGVVGRLTTGAITRYQTAHGLAVTGQVDDALVARLGLHHNP